MMCSERQCSKTSFDKPRVRKAAIRTFVSKRTFTKFFGRRPRR